MDKFILTRYAPKLSQAERSGVIRISDEAFELIQQAMSETGLSAKKIASEAIRFALERLEVKEIK